jgi:hypothetical protein
MESLVVDPRVPFAVDFEFLVANQNAARVHVLAGDFISIRQISHQSAGEFSHFKMEGDVAHRQVICVTIATESDAFDFNKCW